MIRIMKYGEVSNDEIFARAMPTVNVTDKVAEIIRNVRERGDEALREYTEKFDGAKLDSYKADVDSDDAYTPDTEVIKDGYFHESEYRSAPYFDLQIDGITLLNTAF